MSEFNGLHVHGLHVNSIACYGPRYICKCKRHDKVRYECITNGLFWTLATERICSVRFVYDHNGWFDTLHGHQAHSLSLVCHRSEQIGSTRDSVCSSFYVVLFAWFAFNNALKKRLNNSFRSQCKYKRLKTRPTRTRQGYGRTREGRAYVSGGVAMVSCAVEPQESENQAAILVK